MRNRSHTRSAPNQVVLGVLVIAMGLLFLLDNLGIIDFRHALAFWPLAFIVAGIIKLFDTSSQSGYVVGVVLIGVGVTLILKRLGYLYISWNTMWPLLLIALGGVLLFRAATGGRGQYAAGPSLKDEAGSDSVVDVTAILGGFERRIVTPAFRGGEVQAILGGCTLDMRNSSIENEAVLHVFALFGGISIKCPPDWTVVLHGTPILGGVDEKTAAPPDASKRLVITGYVIMGGLEVTN
ncbi:MAG: LiaI-LiaF-like domain-containing protein [Massilia sp.]